MMINNLYVRPTLARNGGRLKDTGFLGYASCSASSLYSILFSQSRLLSYSTNVSFPLINSASSLDTHSDSQASMSDIQASMSDTQATPLSDQWCKEKKAEILKNKFPAVFEDMSKLKESGYFAITNFREKPLSFYSLNNIPGIYMLTNKVTKKFYIGMSKDLKGRFYNYMDLIRLNRDKPPRIHRALIKYGLENFSISILELHNNKVNSSFLREREDFFIRVFKPQYNIKRSKFNLDVSVADNYNAKIKVDIPIKIKNLLDDSLDPANLDCNLIHLKYNSRKNYYVLAFSTPKYLIKANSLGWFKGNINKPIGFECERIDSIPLKTIIAIYPLLDKELLDNFYPPQEGKSGFVVKNRFNAKIKALKMALKAEEKHRKKGS